MGGVLMAGISDANTIDVVAEDAAGDILLIMVEDRPWDADPEQEAQLREKINLYADYINAGNLVREFPDAAGKSVHIQLDCIEEPTEEIDALLQYAAEELQKLDIDLLVNIQD
jgi:uncharacterized protein DUF6572